MNKASIVAFATDKFAKAKTFIKANSPEILIGLGIVGGVATTIMACKETRKVDELNGEFIGMKEDIKCKYGLQHEGFEPDEDTMHAYKKDLTKATIKHAGKIALAYAPAVAMGSASVAAVLAGFGKMKAMYTTSAAAASALLKDYNVLCDRIEKRYGPEARYELVNGVEKETVKEKVVDENGKKKTVTKEVTTLPKDTELNMFSRVWGDKENGGGGQGYFKGDPHHNQFFVYQQLKSLNRLLVDRFRPAKDGRDEIPGIVSFNEVLQAFGFESVDYGDYWGWVYSEENPVGDNFIGIGMGECDDPTTIRFINGESDCVLMNFNCDSNIQPYLKRRGYALRTEYVDPADRVHDHQYELDNYIGWNCNEY